jgi:hypothetical protein
MNNNQPERQNNSDNNQDLLQRIEERTKLGLPPPPDALIDAESNPIHIEISKSRAAKSVKSGLSPEKSNVDSFDKGKSEFYKAGKELIINLHLFEKNVKLLKKQFDPKLYDESKKLIQKIKIEIKNLDSLKKTSNNKSAKNQLDVKIARYHSNLYYFEFIQSQNGESKKDLKIKNIFLAYKGIQNYSDFIYSTFKETRPYFLDFKVSKFDITLFQNIDFEIRFPRGRLHIRQDGVRRVTDVYELIPFLIGELDSEGFALFFDGYSWSEDKVHFVYSENMDKYYEDIIDILKEVATTLENLKNSLK